MSSSIATFYRGLTSSGRRPRHTDCLLKLSALIFTTALLLSGFAVVAVHADVDPIIETDKGKVRGVSVDANGKKVHAFYGIPYARPPLGELRFKPPVQIDPWDGVWDATRLPNSCFQTYDFNFGNFTGSTMWNANTKLSEDCLYLNVWVPRTNPPYENKAVIVWIYGGGFYSGSSTLDIYMAQILAAEKDVIVVSMQYRIGSLGFFSLDSSDAPGNAGLWDQRMALEWVSRNIHHFGGSAHNVTLMGESAGAVSVGLFLVCDLCRGYFQRAILQSGAPQVEWGVLAKEVIWERSEALANELGCPVNDDPSAAVRCLQTKDAADFPEKDNYRVMGFVQFPFVPIVDGVFIRQDPKEMLKRGMFKKVPILLGSNSNEATFFLIYFGTPFEMDTDSPVNPPLYDKAIRDTTFKYYPHFPYALNEFGKEAILFHYRNWRKPNDGIELRKSVDKAASDYYFVCKVNELAKSYARQNVPVYYYWFDQRWSANPWPKWMGVLHADEIWFTFGHPLNRSYSFTEGEKMLSRKMMTYWTNFAKTGDPNTAPGEAPLMEWPRFGEDQRYLNLSVAALNSGETWGSYPRAQECAFWEEYLPMLVAQTSDISDAEREWKLQFHTWKNRYIVDWKTQFDNFLKNYQERMGTCGGGRP
ncbi:carboxylic ester hydrolase [Plakobranchus ocellatus]|uniref:Carboxylic ester hydrolase n=1 Tax=Plakobranchus ocellatus TaxID=259542 RepID=A0AAV4D798_9GAST|nr:carboxylic ester hydrolase [Plakobranchus ocellatus]